MVKLFNLKRYNDFEVRKRKFYRLKYKLDESKDIKNMSSNYSNHDDNNKASNSFNLRVIENKKYNDPSISYKERLDYLNNEIESPYNKLKKLENIKALRMMKYADYLNSQHFQQFREKVLKSRKYRCELCRGKYRLQVHHKHYGSLGNERLDDVLLLCSNCHHRMHVV